MPDEEPAGPVAAEPPAEPIVVVPHIDFAQPTGDPLVEVRKGFGIAEVGGSSPAAAPTAREAPSDTSDDG
jgi:hypothetical protein